MNLSSQPVRDCSKKSQTKKNKIKDNQKGLGAIDGPVRKTVNERSEDLCEGCGKHKLNCWTLENAHVDGRRLIDHKTNETDLVRLCGPSTESGTCHHWVSSTRLGREYMQNQRLRLLDGLKPIKISEWKIEKKEGA